MNSETAPTIHRTGEATGFLPARKTNQKPITVIATEEIEKTFDAKCLDQALNSRGAPGVTDMVLNPDAHCGYGAPIGCVMVSPNFIYPGPVGVDIKCSMSLLQLDLPVDAITEKPLRRALIKAISERTPTGQGRGQRSVPKSRKVSAELGKMIVTQGASEEVCKALGIPYAWAERCEDSFHVGHDDTVDSLHARLDHLIKAGTIRNFEEKVQQCGSYGGGNHFGEAEAVEIEDNDRARSVAETFRLKHNCVAFLSQSLSENSKFLGIMPGGGSANVSLRYKPSFPRC